jgi:hypothetical protein
LQEAVAATRETVDWMRTNFGEHSSDYASSLGLLGALLQRTGDLEAELAARQHLLAIVMESEPPGSALALARTHTMIPTKTVEFEIARAQIEMGLGRNADAIERAKRARELLVPYPFELRLRHPADELVGANAPTNRRMANRR